MKQWLLVLTLMTPLLCATAQDEPAEYRAPVVVELFTSEGCSICPPADEVLAHLTDLGFEPEQVIPLAFHVDYWDNTGWTDPYSHSAWTTRQQKYGRLYRADQIYTPQMIVNGIRQFLGSNQKAARQVIEKAWQRTDPAHVSVKIADAPIKAPTMRVEASYELDRRFTPGVLSLFIAVTEDGLSSDVLDGENKGRHLKHEAVVRYMQRINKVVTAANQNSQYAVEIPLQPEWKRDKMKVVAFIQNITNAAIMGACSQPLEDKTKTES